MQLERAGHIEPSKGGVEGLATIEDEALLMEIMEAREIVDNTEVRARYTLWRVSVFGGICWYVV